MSNSSWTSQDIMRAFVIASLVILMGFSIVHEMVFSTDQQTKNLLIGALIGSFSTGAIQFLFGTSPQSTTKDSTIAQMAQNTEKALMSSPPAASQAVQQIVLPPV